MPAPVISFEAAIAARRERRGIAIALFDGAMDEEPACVAILLCSRETARALVETLGSVAQPTDR